MSETLKIGIASDHAGYNLKELAKSYLESRNVEIRDFGTNSEASCDYPDFVHPLAQALEAGEFPLGIVICGSGNGVCMTANKYPHVRAAMAWEPELGTLARSHNDANVLCLPARYIRPETAVQIIANFLRTPFEGGRHQKRVEKIARPG